MVKLNTFHRFPDLPPELRQEIWNFAIPDQIEASLFSFEGYYWKCRKANTTDDDEVEGDWGSDGDFSIDTGGGPRDHEFNYDLLGLTSDKFPIAYVNREARNAVLKWVYHRDNETGVYLSTINGDLSAQEFSRPFLPDLDIMFILLQDWDDIVFQVDTIYNAIQWDDDADLVTGPAVQRLAIPEKLLFKCDSIATLLRMLDCLPMVIKEFIIVSKEISSKEYAGCNTRNIERRWELIDTNLIDIATHKPRAGPVLAKLEDCLHGTRILRAREKPPGQSLMTEYFSSAGSSHS